MWMAEGMTSLLDCPRFTWSLGMHRVLAAAAAGEDLVGAAGDHLVGVHVGGGPGAGLEDAQDELVVEAAGEHLRRRLGDRPGNLGGEQPELAVHHRGRSLDAGHGADEVTRHARPADRQVRRRTRGLRAVIGLRRDPDRAQRVLLLAHRPAGAQASFIRSMFARSWAISIPRLTHCRPIRHCSASFGSRKVFNR